MLKHIEKKGLFTSILLFLLPFIVALYFGVDWQSNLISITLKLNTIIETNYGMSFIFLSLMVLTYILLGILKILAFNKPRWPLYNLFTFLFFELTRIFFISVGIFLMIISIVFERNNNFTSSTFYIITFLTFLATWSFYMVLRFISNILLKNYERYNTFKEEESDLFNIFEVNGTMYFFVTAVTVLILADTIGNTAFDSVVRQIEGYKVQVPSNSSEIKQPSLDNFVESRLFQLIIPSLAIYILSIRTALPKGIKK